MVMFLLKNRDNIIIFFCMLDGKFGSATTPSDFSFSLHFVVRHRNGLTYLILTEPFFRAQESLMTYHAIL
jgi:hypothetical protein